MAQQTLALNKTVHALCTQYPQLPPILAQLGFTDILQPGMLQTMGRFMTLPKGAMMKKLDLETVKQALSAHGYTVVDEGSDDNEQGD